MNKTSIGKRIFAIMLTFMMGLSMTGYTFVEAFAEDGEEQLTNEETTDAVTDGTETPAGGTEGTETVTEGAGGEAQEAVDGTAEEAAETEETQEVPEVTLEAQSVEETAELAEIKVAASRDGTFLSVFWSRTDGTEYYMVYLDKDTDAAQSYKVEAVKDAEGKDDTDRKYVFKDVSADAAHTVMVEAYRAKETAAESGESGTEDTAGETGESTEEQTTEPEYEVFAEGTASEISAILRAGLSGYPYTAANYMNLSLRTMLGEANDGYAVAQGAATDGKYAYYLMVSSSTQKGRVLKVNLSNSSDYKAGPVINTHHGNGMTYDSKRGQLVACGYGSYRHQLTYIDPDTLTIVSQPSIQYSNTEMEAYKNGYYANGIAAIAYVEEYDVYVARMRGDIKSSAKNDIMVIDASTLEMIGYVRTKVSAKYPETYQSMDADEKYVYFLASPGSGQSKNIIIALDWNSENLLPAVNAEEGEPAYVEDMWYCNNNGTAEPDAVYTIPLSNESEGLFHTTDPSTGEEHFYVSIYYGRWHYKTVKKTVTYKKKWKKVRKWYNKKTGKWQSKKPKKKYRGASKKVWKYKTKKKKVYVTEKDYWARDDYVYDLGVI